MNIVVTRVPFISMHLLFVSFLHVHRFRIWFPTSGRPLRSMYWEHCGSTGLRGLKPPRRSVTMLLVASKGCKSLRTKSPTTERGFERSFHISAILKNKIIFFRHSLTLNKACILLTLYFQVDSIINKISYPSYILNSTFLDTYYKQVRHLMLTG